MTRSLRRFSWPILLLLGCSSEPAAEPDPSEPELVLEGDSTGFRALAEPVTFRMENAALLADAERVDVFVNGEPLAPEQITLGDGTVSFALVAEGRNDVEVFALSSEEELVVGRAVIFGGSQTLAVRVVDADGVEVPATVRAILVEDEEAFEEGSFEGGGLVFEDVPMRTMVLTARAADGSMGTAGLVGGGEAVIRLRPALAPSSVDNNDFRAGLDGWTSYAVAATLVAHDEDGDGTVPYGTDQDLMIATAGQMGPQTVSRSFEPELGKREVTVRYRFVTSEVPGGYFGSEFNDYFSISVRAGDGTVHEIGSMNGLGLASFDANGATEWREAKITIEPLETVQVDMTVANVADGAYDSHVVIDMIEETSLEIEEVLLRDIDDSELTMLSASPHSYKEGRTLVNGAMWLRGDADDTVEDVTLEVVQGTTTVYGQLVPRAREALVQSFGEDERIVLDEMGELFAIDAAALAAIDTSKDGKLETRVRVRTTKGEESVYRTQKLGILKLFSGTNRYPPRDEGGDDWVLPSVEGVLLSSGIQVGDISNMNGGPFPKHKSHQGGFDVDAKFPGYAERDAETAAEMLRHLDSPYGSRIQKVFVTYKNKPAFANAIAGVVLKDGRKATDVIRDIEGHEDHFHWRVAPAK